MERDICPTAVLYFAFNVRPYLFSI